MPVPCRRRVGPGRRRRPNSWKRDCPQRARGIRRVASGCPQETPVEQLRWRTGLRGERGGVATVSSGTSCDCPGSGAGSLGRARGDRRDTSELQSPCNLVCRLLLEKKKKKKYN